MYDSNVSHQPAHVASAKTVNQSTLILIGGGSGAGKTSIAEYLRNLLGQPLTSIVPIDAYYRDRRHMTLDDPLANNFDSPDALDYRLLNTHIRSLLTGQSIERPRYDYQTHRRREDTYWVSPKRYLVVEGLFALYWPTLRSQSNVTVFVTMGNKLGLSRRIRRDISERGGNEASIRSQWKDTVWPMYLNYVEPTRQFANLILDGTKSIEQSAKALARQIVTLEK
tara:strand:+ start:86 stop:757 length:672 start_codon:yes stop_codon:yes gene_type:complete